MPFKPGQKVRWTTKSRGVTSVVEIYDQVDYNLYRVSVPNRHNGIILRFANGDYIKDLKRGNLYE